MIGPPHREAKPRVSETKPAWVMPIKTHADDPSHPTKPVGRSRNAGPTM